MESSRKDQFVDLINHISTAYKKGVEDVRYGSSYGLRTTKSTIFADLKKKLDTKKNLKAAALAFNTFTGENSAGIGDTSERRKIFDKLSESIEVILETREINADAKATPSVAVATLAQPSDVKNEFDYEKEYKLWTAKVDTFNRELETERAAIKEDNLQKIIQYAKDKTEIERLQTALQTAQKEKTGLEEKSRQDQKAAQTETEKLAAHEQELQNLTIEMKALNTQHQITLTQLTKARKGKTKLTEKHIKDKEITAQAEAKKIAALEQKLQQSATEMKALDTKYQETLALLVKAKKEKTELAEKNRQDKEAATQAETAKLATLENQLQSLATEMKTLDAKYKATLSQLAKTEQELKDIKPSAQKSITAIDTLKKESKEKYDSLFTEAQANKDKLTKLEWSIADLKKKHQTIVEDISAKLNQAKIEYINLKQQATSKDSLIAQQRKNITDLETQVSSQNKTITELEAKNTAIQLSSESMLKQMGVVWKGKLTDAKAASHSTASSTPASNSGAAKAPIRVPYTKGYGVFDNQNQKPHVAINVSELSHASQKNSGAGPANPIAIVRPFT